MANQKPAIDVEVHDWRIGRLYVVLLRNERLGRGYHLYVYRQGGSGKWRRLYWGSR